MTASKSSFNFKTLAAAGLLSAALVGCGGGSESTVSTTPEPTTPTTPAPAPDPDPAPDTASDPYADAKKALSDAQMAYDSLPATATYADKQEKQAAIKTAADGLVTALQTGGASFSDVKDAMDVSSAANSKATIYGNIVTAEGNLKTAQTALKNLPAAATYEQKRDAQTAIKTAANALSTALEAGNASASEIQTATDIGDVASNQETIYSNIVTAEGKLKEAQTALTGLPATATYEQKRDAQQKIQTAASNLAKAQEASGDSAVTANTTAMEAKAEVESLNDIIAAVNKVKAAYDTAKSLVENLDEDSSAISIAQARTAVTEAIKATSDPNLPATEKTSYLANINTLTETIVALDPEPPVPNDVANWDNAIDDYDFSGDMDDLPGGNNSDLVTTANDIEFTLNGRELRGTRVRNLPNGWRGESYEDTRGDDFADSGRVFTNNDGVNVGVAFQNIINDLHDIRSEFVNEGNVNVLERDNADNDDGNMVIAFRGNTNWVNTGINRTHLENGRDNAGGTRGNLTGITLPTGNTELVLDDFGTNAYRMDVFGVDMTVSSAANTAVRFRFTDDGELQIRSNDGSTAGTLTFSPLATNAAATTSAITDDVATSVFTTQFQVAYAEFGYWSEVTPDSPFVSIDTFARVMDNDLGLTSQPGQLTGDAEYEGIAAGYYVIDEDGTLSNGEFTARVKLEADFDDSEISGDIDRFRSATNTDHNSTLRDWDLALDDAGFGNNNRNLDAVFDGTTDGGGPDDGEWQGQFAGNNGLGTIANNDDHPQVVVGEFIGHFSDTDSAIGAFGAEIN